MIDAAPSIVHRTRSFCCECQAWHAAALREEAGHILFDVVCPRVPQTRSVLVSSDAEAFRHIRGKSAFPAPPLPSSRGITWANFVEITRECNCTCAICFAAARPGAGTELSVDDVVGIARKLKARGTPAITLSGGEPTLHPRLTEIVAAIRAMGMDVTVASNGLLLGRDPELARRIRRAGVTYVYVQFDTLRGDVCRTMRGDDFVDLKKRALANVRESGLYFGITTTVIRDNLDETGAVLRYAAEHVPHLAVVGYLCAAPAGRFTLSEEVLVNREDVIAALIRSGVVEGLGREHFWPFPRFAPWGLDVHPDCAALLFLGVDRGRIRPLDRDIDIGRMYRLMSRHEGRFQRLWGVFLVCLYFVLSIRPTRILSVLRMQIGMLTKLGRSSMMVVSVEHFLGSVYQDQERLDRCTTCNVQRDGTKVLLCMFEHPDVRRSPVTRAGRRNEETARVPGPAGSDRREAEHAVR